MTHDQNDVPDELGLYEKFEVYRGGELVDDCFVLRPEVDPAAYEALKTYADETDNETLGADLREWIDMIPVRADFEVDE